MISVWIYMVEVVNGDDTRTHALPWKSSDCKLGYLFTCFECVLLVKKLCLAEFQSVYSPFPHCGENYASLHSGPGKPKKKQFA